MAAVRDRRSPPRRLVARGRRARDPHRDQRARRVRADHAARRGDPVRVSVSPAVAGPRDSGVRSAHRDRRHEPRAPAARLPRVADRALARLRQLAGRGAARARDRQRRQAVVDARADRDLHRRRAGRGLDAHRSRFLRSRRHARAGDGARGDHPHRVDDLHGRRASPERLGAAGGHAGVVARQALVVLRLRRPARRRSLGTRRPAAGPSRWL